MIGFVLRNLLLIAIAALCAAVLLLLGTPAGARWLVGQAQPAIPGELVVEDLGGSVLTGLTADRVVYRQDAFIIELADARVNLRLHALLRKRVMIRRATAARVTVGALRLADVALSGHFDLVENLPLAGSVRWRLADQTVSGRGNFSGDLKRLAFTQDVALPAAVAVRGALRELLGEPSIEATARFTELPFAVGSTPVSARDGRIALAGTLAAFTVGIETDVHAADAAPIAFSADLRGNTEKLTIERARALAFGGHLDATGLIGLGDAVTATLAVSGEDLDPSLVRADLSGRLGFALRVDARAVTDIDITLDRLSGVFLATPVDGSGAAQWRDGALAHVELKLQSGPNRLALNGRMTPALGGDLQLDAPKLTTLWPGIAGALAGTARLAGTLEAPVVAVNLNGANLRVADWQLARVAASGRIDRAGVLDLDAQADAVQTGAQLLGNITLGADGTLADHRLALRVAEGPVDIRTTTRGAWDGVRLAATIETADVAHEIAGAWQLVNPVQAAFTKEDVSLDAHCWRQLPTQLCTDGVRRSAGRWTGAATLTDLPLATFDPWLGEDLQITGTADADVTVDWREGEPPTARIAWRQGETILSLPDAEADADLEPLRTTLRDVTATLAVDADRAVFDARANGDLGLTLAAAATLDTPFATDDGQIGGPLAGRLTAQVPDIGALRAVLSRYVLTGEVGGALAVNADVSGTWNAPEFAGSARLSGGSAAIAVTGITVTDVDLSVSGKAGEPLIVAGSARSGTGTIGVDGQIDWSDERGAFADLHVVGDAFEILRLPDQRAVIAPDLQLAIDDRKLGVTGRVRVPEAEFIVRELGRTAVAVSPDVVVHDAVRPDERPTPGPQPFGAVELELGDNVRFRGLGIDTRLTGALELVDTIDAPPTAEGSLQLADGSYAMFGKVLTIEQGSLNFYGPLDDPLLDVRAVRRIRYQQKNVRVGVIVTGNLSRPLDFLLFSDPVYSDTDILSFMLSDRPASTADDLDASAISGAAIALGLKSLNLTEGLSNGLTLDELALENAGGGDAAVVAGKRLSNDLFVRYTYGLFNRIGTLYISYDIGAGFSIEAGSGEQQTLDLMYSIDR